MQYILSLRNICKQRAQGDGFRLVIEKLDVARGALIALVGPSGCGKSTALDMMAAVLQPDSGETLFFAPQDTNIDILEYWKKGKRDALAALRRQYIGYVLQTGGLLPFLTGRDNILLACHGVCAPSDMGHTFEERVTTLAKTLSISHILYKKPAHMSVGERQRVAIARALVGNPILVLADEPVASLDPLSAAQVMELFVTIAQEQGITVIMVTHTPEVAAGLGFCLVETKVHREGASVLAHMAQGTH